MKATFCEGGIYIDQRGVLKYVNEENPGHYRRFYLITHPDIKIIRAWQGHKQEEKAFYAINGSFIIAVVNPVNFEMPADDEKPDFFQINVENNHFLRVPGGCYTGIKALIPNSTLLVLSGLDLTDSKADDFRLHQNKWIADWSIIK